MADTERVVTQAKRNSYLRHVQIHMELLQQSLAGEHFGCGVGQYDREEIEKRLDDIWNITCAAMLAVVDARPTPPPSAQVLPFRPRKAG